MKTLRFLTIPKLASSKSKETMMLNMCFREVEFEAFVIDSEVNQAFFDISLFENISF